jgi:ribosomal protein L23
VRGNRIKHRPNWKKAVVTLAPGDKIELFQGV